MNRSTILVALAAAVLTACGMPHHHLHAQVNDHDKPVVSVKAGVVSVSPEPLVFGKNERNVVILWRLEKGYTFAENGITIDGVVMGKPGAAASALDPRQDEIIDCKRVADGRQFRCLNRNSKPGVYKYTVRVLQDGKPLAPLDPNIMNIE